MNLHPSPVVQRNVFVVVAALVFMAGASYGAFSPYTPPKPYAPNIAITQGTTGNGGLETGGTTPFFGALGATLNTVSSPVGGGAYSLRVSEFGTPRVSSRADHRRQSIGLNGLADGDIFHISLDYYVPSSNGYNQIIFTPLTYNGTTVVESGAIVNINPITQFDQWVSFDGYWLTDTDGFDGIQFRVEYRRNGGGDATYEGFIDNVVITQGALVPEPTTLAVFCFGLLTCLRRERRPAR